LLDQLNFDDISILRTYSKHADALEDLYQQIIPVTEGGIDYSLSADEVAKRLVGRILYFANYL